MLPLAIALVLGIAGSRLLMIEGRTALVGGILLLVAALLSAAIALGGEAYGPEVEGQPDLSSRLALGLLGGVLAGLVHGMLTVATGALGIAELLGAGIDVQLSALDWWYRAAAGGMWGIGLGAFYPALPGASFLGKGAAFGLLLAAWQLFYVYPFELGLGMLGADAGWGVLPLVVVGNVVGGAIAAWPVSWGGRSRVEALSAPLVT
ncbi:MAG: hypothetical protein R3266_01140 [Gemmatimonadota bacterium]|nr:hypothetical protein [Gemmatimonadota bacterium]